MVFNNKIIIQWGKTLCLTTTSKIILSVSYTKAYSMSIYDQSDSAQGLNLSTIVNQTMSSFTIAFQSIGSGSYNFWITIGY